MVITRQGDHIIFILSTVSGVVVIASRSDDLWWGLERLEGEGDR
jgi:hypothetical protein